MSPDLERLIRLQQLETALEDAKRAIASHPQRLESADARLDEAKRTLEIAKHHLKDCQDARRALEKEAAVFQGRLTKFKDQLSEVKTNREYQALQHEIEMATTELRAIEDKVLEKMLDADVFAADVKKAETALTAQQQAIEAEKKGLVSELAATEQSLRDATIARARLVGEIEPRLLTLFTHVAKARKGVAICPTNNGLCSLCHVRLRPPVYQQVRHNDSIVQCESCQRILYFVPPAPVQPPTIVTS